MMPVSQGSGDRDVVVRRWAHDPENVRLVRDELLLCLVKWRIPVEVSDCAAVVVSELFTNSLRHAGRPRGRHIETRFVRRGGGVRIEVHDANSQKPELREATGDDECGRGLFLVDALTQGRWGVGDRQGPGKVVWAECRAAADVRKQAPRRRRRPRTLHQEPASVTWAREKAGLTKRALAQRVGISEQLAGEIESGWRSATPANLAKIAAVLGCPLVALERKSPADEVLVRRI